jgi:hypothetical protein
MSRQPWLDSELGLGGALRQALGLIGRGLARARLTVPLSVLLALGVGAFSLWGKREFAPELVLRVVEPEQATPTAPKLKRQLADYVREGVFTSEPLLRIMRQHGLYPSLLRSNARAALEAFKEDIQIDVYRNYFVEQRTAGSGPRSARLTVSFRSKDPQLALSVTRALGALVVERERAVRREQALTAARDAVQARDLLLAAWQRRSSNVISLQRELGEHPDPRLQVQLIGSLGSLGALEREIDAAERRTAALELSAALERGGVGMYFEVVDEGSLPGRATQVKRAIVAALVTFAFGLPLVALGVGAFGQSGVSR